MSTGDKAEFEGLIERFGKAWEGGDAGEMAAVFAETGVFVPDPHGNPVVGRDAVAEYWKDIPYEQSEVSFRSGEIHVAGPWFAAEFKCTFRRRRTGDPMDVRGALFCETAGGEITEMRMYYQRRAVESDRS
jgi:ketosteroid isomerase-like protein